MIMKKFFRDHPDAILAAIGAIMIAAIVGLYSWGIGDITVTLNRALNYVPAQTTVGFDLTTAAQLDWRGLVK